MLMNTFSFHLTFNNVLYIYSTHDMSLGLINEKVSISIGEATWMKYKTDIMKLSLMHSQEAALHQGGIDP